MNTKIDYRVHMIVLAAKRDGRLVPQSCERCGKPGRAHHEDYDKPLDVMWLCRSCHSKRHIELGWGTQRKNIRSKAK